MSPRPIRNISNKELRAWWEAVEKTAATTEGTQTMTPTEARLERDAERLRDRLKDIDELLLAGADLRNDVFKLIEEEAPRTDFLAAAKKYDLRCNAVRRAFLENRY